MNTDVKTINKFLTQNKEFSKITKSNGALKIKLKGSEFDYETKDFSVSSSLRNKLNELEASLGLEVV